MTISVIGAGGHVGLPLCVVMAKIGKHKVFGIEKDVEKILRIKKGKFPYYEDQGDVYLKAVITNRKLLMTNKLEYIAQSKIIIVIIGTPIDEHFNPSLLPLYNLFREIAPYLRKKQLVILRSTVAPGTTERIKEIIEETTQLKVDEDLYLVFAPERVLQGKSISEIQCLPQHIGAYSLKSYTIAKNFFKTFIKADCFFLTPVEAELSKLFTNMARYVNFALANEYYLIAEAFGVNINKIIAFSNYHYPRLNLPQPGPNVGGPCLQKDGWFLLQYVPFNELISTAFRINEGIVAQIVKKLTSYYKLSFHKIVILGMTFKANSDDTRNSLSFKLKKLLEMNGLKPIIMIEPNLPNFHSLKEIENAGAVILMTPHHQFKDLKKIVELVKNPLCIYVDIWGFWKKMQYKSCNGYFLGKEL